jgi:threonine dehydrogenase-like Zn-dependent dehydrogenase
LVGRVVAKGKGVGKFNVGDIVASPFSLSCGKSHVSVQQEEIMLISTLGDCFYCQLGNTARCAKQRAFGTPTADGGQAEYINLSMADSSLFKAPEGMPIDLMVLMTDIIPTGYSVARNALTLLEGDGVKSKEKSVCVVIGCGPVSCFPQATLLFIDIHS